MELSDKESWDEVGYDISIIRPQMRNGDIRMRGKGMSSARLNSIKKGLLGLHTLEGLAINIYRFQITKEESELNRHLIAAMCNEMTHLQDFQVKLLEYGWKPSRLRWAYLIVGFALGCVSRLMGTQKILRTGIWVETKAVRHYGRLLETVDWDEATRRVIEKDQADEAGHMNRWKKLIESRK